jgi:hypothetical protein
MKEFMLFCLYVLFGINNEIVGFALLKSAGKRRERRREERRRGERG